MSAPLSLLRCEVHNSEYICFCGEGFSSNSDALYHEGPGGKKHPFHPACIMDWLKTQQEINRYECPSCRAPIRATLLGNANEFPSLQRWDYEKSVDMRVFADVIRLFASHGATPSLRKELKDIKVYIPDDEFRKHTIKVAMHLAEANGHASAKELLITYLETGVVPEVPEAEHGLCT